MLLRDISNFFRSSNCSTNVFLPIKTEALSYVIFSAFCTGEQWIQFVFPDFTVNVLTVFSFDQSDKRHTPKVSVLILLDLSAEFKNPCATLGMLVLGLWSSGSHKTANMNEN